MKNKKEDLSFRLPNPMSVEMMKAIEKVWFEHRIPKRYTVRGYWERNGDVEFFSNVHARINKAASKGPKRERRIAVYLIRYLLARAVEIRLGGLG